MAWVWLIAETTSKFEILCVNRVSRTRQASIMALRDYLKGFEDLRLDKDFDRKKLKEGGVVYSRGNRKIFITRYRLK